MKALTAAVSGQIPHLKVLIMSVEAPRMIRVNVKIEDQCEVVYSLLSLRLDVRIFFFFSSSRGWSP